jgi:hypothetical protein
MCQQEHAQDLQAVRLLLFYYSDGFGLQGLSSVVDTVADLWQQLLAAAVTHNDKSSCSTFYIKPPVIWTIFDLQNGRISIWTMPGVE